jgi:hypothetical protein
MEEQTLIPKQEEGETKVSLCTDRSFSFSGPYDGFGESLSEEQVAAPLSPFEQSTNKRRPQEGSRRVSNSERRIQLSK